MGTSRSLSVVVGAATVLAGLATGPASASPAYDSKPVATGATWMSGELTDGLVHNEQFDFDDYGLSIDVALGLDGAGRKADVVQAITKAVAHHVDSYTTFGFNVYAGATAKAIVLAVAQGKNPHLFGGTDLVNRLETRVATAAPITGRIEDAFDPNDKSGADYANVIGQAYAAAALSAVDSPEAASVAGFLIQQQCDKGYFRQYFTTDKTRADQSCQGAPRKERGASTDATALAILALQEVKGPEAKAAVEKAVAWLTDVQQGGGGFSDSGRAAAAANANSTGLAGWALGKAGETKPAAKAAVWVRNYQVPATNPCAGELTGEAGAIAYDDTAYGTAQGAGITRKASDQWRRASAQALPVLRWAPSADGDFTATAPRRVQAGEKLRIRLTGVAAGQRVCVSGAGRSYEFPSGRHATTQVSFAVPGGAGSRTYDVWLGNERRSVTVRVTG